LSFYKGDLSIKELFAHSYNQPYYYSENQYFETYQKLEYTQAIDYLNNIHCGENNFLQSEKKHLIIRKFNAQ
jgi:hypothetical protein